MTPGSSVRAKNQVLAALLVAYTNPMAGLTSSHARACSNRARRLGSYSPTQEIGAMTSNASAIESPACVMLSARTSTAEATTPVSMKARYTAGALQVREKTWCPVGIGIPADAAVAAVMATWRHR